MFSRLLWHSIWMMESLLGKYSMTPLIIILSDQRDPRLRYKNDNKLRYPGKETVKTSSLKEMKQDREGVGIIS